MMRYQSLKINQMIRCIVFLAYVAVIIFSLPACKGPAGEDGVDGLTGPAGPSPVLIVPDQCNDIQEAIDSLAKNEGGTVYIKSGTYTVSEGIHINRSNITISGEQGTLIRLDDDVNQPVILIGSDAEVPQTPVENIRIENLEIDGNKESQNSETDPERPWIRNNCIDVRMVRDLWISGVDLHHARSGGLVVSWDSRNMFIDQSTFHHNYFDGIALYASQYLQVTNFFCYENGAAGLSLDNEIKDVLFSNGLINNHGDVGIFARNARDLSFHSIVVSDNLNHGCFLSHESLGTNSGVVRLLFNGCSFLDNQGYGLYLASPENESPDNAVIGCLFSGNTEGAIYVDPNGALSQEGNIFLAGN